MAPSRSRSNSSVSACPFARTGIIGQLIETNLECVPNPDGTFSYAYNLRIIPGDLVPQPLSSSRSSTKASSAKSSRRSSQSSKARRSRSSKARRPRKARSSQSAGSDRRASSARVSSAREASVKEASAKKAIIQLAQNTSPLLAQFTMNVVTKSGRDMQITESKDFDRQATLSQVIWYFRQLNARRFEGDHFPGLWLLIGEGKRSIEKADLYLRLNQVGTDDVSCIEIVVED